MPGGMQVAEPYSEEAMLFTKELVLQREVRLLFLLRFVKICFSSLQVLFLDFPVLLLFHF